MAVVGPALGYVFGAMSLRIFTDFYIFSSDEYVEILQSFL